MSWLEIVAVIGIVCFVIYQQFAGQLLQARRVVVLPVVVTVVGAVSLHDHHLGPADVAWLAAGAAGSLLIGLAFGAMMRLVARDGVLWGQLPLRGCWLWAALIGWRALTMVLAARTGAHVAASTTPLLFTLGLNRVGQAAVIVLRAMRSGIPFAPDKDGRTFGAGLLGGRDRASNAAARSQDYDRRPPARYGDMLPAGPLGRRDRRRSRRY